MTGADKNIIINNELHDYGDPGAEFPGFGYNPRR
jgi:hypothetical protein